MSELKNSTKMALIVLICAVVWVASGLVFKSKDEAEKSVISENKGKTVRVLTSKSELVVSEFIVSGRTQAESSVVMKSEVKGIVDKIVAKEGSLIKENDVIVKLKEDDRKAKISEAKANLNLKELEFKNYSSLVAGGYSTKVKKTDALANYEAAKTALLTAELNYDKSIIKAPFTGYLEEIEVKDGDFVDIGSVISKIIDLDPIEIAVYIPEKYMSSIIMGEKAKIERSGYDFDAQISFISKSALEQTRAFLVKLRSKNPDMKIPEGLTVKLSIPLKEAKAHKIKSSILTLNPAGDVGVKVLNPENKVEFYKINIDKENDDGSIWVSGLPDETRVITVGQEYVVEGELIKNIVEEVK